MAKVHGRSAHFEIDNSGGTLTDISAYLTNVSFTRNGEAIDVTTFQTSGFNRGYIPGLAGATITIEGIFDSASTYVIDSTLNGIVNAAGSFEYGPAGTATNDPQYTGECICTEYSPSAPVDGAVTFSASFTVDGAVTRGAY